MSVSGPSPLGTLMVQRVEAALGVTVSQQANIATGARPDAVTQPGQPDKVDPAKNPPPKEQEGSRQAQGRQGNLAALARSDPEIARLLAARNAPMTAYTSSAPTTLGQAAKTILALFQQFPDARPAVAGRAPLLPQGPGQAAGQPGQAAGGSPTPAQLVAGNLDQRAVEALMQRAGGGQNAAQNPGTPTQPSPNAQPGATAQPGGNPPAAGGQGQAAVVQQNPGAAAPANAAPAGNAQQPATGGQAPSPNASAAASSSASTAQQAASQAGRGPNPGPALAQAPQPMSLGSLFLAPNSLAGQLAMALSQAMQSSGLFYEAHLRELAFGQRTPEQLRSEPQAQAGREAGTTQQNPSAAAQARGTGEASGNQPGQATSSSQGGQQAAPTQAGAAAQASAQLAGALLGMDPSTHALVRQQLEVLANQSFAWQGEAWPGGDLEWEVQRRDPQEGGEDTESWSTQLKLQLPGLGEVHARVSLATHQLVMHLTAPEAAGMIADHTGLLRERLGLHGLQLSQLTISRDAIAEDGTQS